MSGNPVDDLGEALSGLESAGKIVKEISSLADVFRPYKPVIRSFRIDYLNRSSEMKYLLEVPAGISRLSHRKLEFILPFGFKVYDMLDLDTAAPVRIDFDRRNQKYICDLDKLPKSERFLVTTRGEIGVDFLDRLVAVSAAADPKKEGDSDVYWVHAILKDNSILERVWNDLNVDRVNVDVRIGVERYFTSQIPDKVKKSLEVQRKLLDAIKRGDRNIEKLRLQYRRLDKDSGVTPADIVEFAKKLVSGEFFSQYVRVDTPFLLGRIEPERDFTSLVPERVAVATLSDLNLRNPAAKGHLIFDRVRYVDAISDEIESAMPTKKKSSPRTSD